MDSRRWCSSSCATDTDRTGGGSLSYEHQYMLGRLMPGSNALVAMEAVNNIVLAVLVGGDQHLRLRFDKRDELPLHFQ